MKKPYVPHTFRRGLSSLIRTGPSFLPDSEDVPPEFENASNLWHRFVKDWFFNGLPETRFLPKEGIDKNRAIRHIATILNSDSIHFDRKIPSSAYLLSLWFEEETASYITITTP